MNQRKFRLACVHAARPCSPFALRGVPQNSRDYSEACKSFVRVLHTFVLVRAVAIVASVPGPVYR